MSDRYSDRYDSYGDGYGSRRDGARRSRSESRDSRSGSSRMQRSTWSSDGQSRTRRSAGSYSDDYRSGYSSDYWGGGSGGRLSQSSDAQYRRRPSGVFDDYYSDEQVESYRRSAYGANAAETRPRRSRTSGQRSAREAAPSSSSSARTERSSRASRASADSDYAPKRSNRKRNLIIAAVVVVAVVLVGAGMAFAYMNAISSNLHEGVDDELRDALVPTKLADEPFYMLLMGTDTSAERAADPDYGDTMRSDSMMLARIDPQNKKVTLISIHRDTLVDLGQYGEQKINAAYEVGGAAGAVQAVSKLAGVDISHYASIDFDGFRAMVDALGGVEVEVPIEIDDWMAGGHVDAGLQTLNGEQALILCRSRHSYDDVADDGDVMRAANQRMVLSAIAKKILASDVLTIANTVQTMSQYATTDMELSDIIGLAQLMQGLDPAADIYTAMEPTEGEYIDDTWYEVLDESAWRQMISRMDQGLPPVNKTEIDDATGTVLSTGGADAPVV